VLRRLSGAAGAGFRLIRKATVLQRLGFTSPHQFEALAVVSNNDYTKNVRSYGWATNVDIIKGVPAELVQDTIAILVYYVNYVNRKRVEESPISLETFQPSIDIFANLNPTYNNVRQQQQQPNSTPDVFAHRLELFDSLKKMRDKCKISKDNAP
ncbi:hypothetical protein BGZ97_010850, partial [Linnemannia gamsii]